MCANINSYVVLKWPMRSSQKCSARIERSEASEAIVIYCFSPTLVDTLTLVKLVRHLKFVRLILRSAISESMIR